MHGRFWVLPPSSDARGLWLVGFHGYGQSSEEFLEFLSRIERRDQWLVVSVQALHPFYTSRSNQVVANWMTRQDREYAIADNVAYVDTVMDQLAAEFGPPQSIVYAGFSQGVAMAYRAGLLGRRACAAIIAACADVPPELKKDETRTWPRVLAASATSDTYYTPEMLESDMEFVRRHSPEARKLVFEGGHEWSAEVVTAAGALLAEIEAKNW